MPQYLDVGARNLKNRKRSYTYRPLFDKFKYYGMDTSPGNNVDIVGYENIRGTFDILISGQTMEHVKQPWEWVRSLVPYFSHYICIIAPHTWKEHKNLSINVPLIRTGISLMVCKTSLIMRGLRWLR